MTERQEQILDALVREYVKTACPVSSQAIERKTKLGLSPATIRNEMADLTKEGYLAQPHTASGRMPTDKGYRIVVNKILESEEKISRAPAEISEPSANYIDFTRAITRHLAEHSVALVAAYILPLRLMWKEGWEDVLLAPEFAEHGFPTRFTQFLQDIEEHIAELDSAGAIRVYIGRENPFSRIGDFSVMIADIQFPDSYEGKIAMIGPKRMPYNKNIMLMQSLLDFLEERK